MHITQVKCHFVKLHQCVCHTLYCVKTFVYVLIILSPLDNEMLTSDDDKIIHLTKIDNLC